MKKTITFVYHLKSYVSEVLRSSNGYPVIYTAFLPDDALRGQFVRLTFNQETSTSEILPSASNSREESELKAIILEKINCKKQLFEIEPVMINLL